MICLFTLGHTHRCTAYGMLREDHKGSSATAQAGAVGFTQTTCSFMALEMDDLGCRWLSGVVVSQNEALARLAESPRRLRFWPR